MAILLVGLALAAGVCAPPLHPYDLAEAHPFESGASNVSSCTDLHKCRTPWGLVYSCLSTLFACVWIAIHPNIPAQHGSTWGARLYSARLAALSLIFPEVLVTVAAVQFLAARRLSQKCISIEGWTPTHSFFTIMGGFFNSSTGGVVLPSDLRSPRNVLHEYDLIIREGDTPPVQTVGTSEKEILDRSKGNGLAKLIVVIQTLWFVAQYLGRWFDHLPRTQLEVMTLAYAALAIAVYRLWWHKPLNVQLPIDVLRSHNPQSKTRYLHIKMLDFERLPTSGQTDRALVFIVGPGIAVIFGAIHCLAWSFPFPTPKERLLWRICAAFLTGAPIAFSMVTYFGTGYTYLYNEFKLKESGMAGWIAVFLLAAYFVCRNILFVVTFTSLRSVLPGVYQTVNWVSFIPHVG